MNGSVVSMPLLYRIIDAYIGQPQKDWSAEVLKGYKPLLEQAAAAEKKAEGERVMGTKPTLDLARYAGKYSNEFFGDVTITIEDDQLKFAYGPSFTSPLEHWNYDTFRASFFAAGVSKVSVTFPINPQGKVDTLQLGMPGMGGYPFKRIAEPEKNLAATGSKAQ